MIEELLWIIAAVVLLVVALIAYNARGKTLGK